MGQVYYDMGVLSSKEVIECSASDLVGQYIGQTGPKTKKLLEKALGRVLFVDEAYRLSEGHFAQEAIDELVGLLTQEKFKSKIIVILAGYDQDMNKLMAVNSGLASRFPEQIQFKNMELPHCLELLRRELTKKDIVLPGLESPSSTVYVKMEKLLTEISVLPSWGNARDMLTLSRNMIKEAILAAPDAATQVSVILPERSAIACAEAMLADQRERCNNVPKTRRSDPFERLYQEASMDPQPSQTSSIIQTQTKSAVPSPPPPEVNRHDAAFRDGRDPGVTDAVWNELEAATRREKEQSRENEKAAARLQQELNEQRLAIQRQQIITQELQRAVAKDEAERQELQRKREAARLKELEARRLVAALEQERQRAEEKRKKEAAIQVALQKMGVCVAGFRWIKQGSGYRCAGGSHFVSNAQLPS